MGRVRDLLDLSQTLNPLENKPKYAKYKYFGGGCNNSKRFDRDHIPDDDELQHCQDYLRHERAKHRKSRPSTAPAGGRRPPGPATTNAAAAESQFLGARLASDATQ